MDRIRDAISRARTDEVEPPQNKAPRQRIVAPAPAIENQLDFPVVHCDTDAFHRHRIISNEQDPVLNAYRVLRTRVLQKIEQNNWKSIAVLSASSGAGKTVTAINLAIALGSKAGIRPTLVDIDFYRPSIARYLGIEVFPSVLDFYEGKKSVEDVTVKPDLPGMLLIPNERVTRRGAEFLNTEKTDELIDTATNRYGSRVVIFDLSPLLGCDDGLAFVPKVDCVLLIAASGQTRVAELKESKRLLGDANIIGTVLNKSPRSLMPNQYY